MPTRRILHQSAVVTCERSVLGHYTSMAHTCSMQQASCDLTVKVMLMQKHSAELKAASTVLVIGGGAVGVELAGMLPHLSVHVHLPVCMSVCSSAACLSMCLPVCFPLSMCLPALDHLSDWSLLYLAVSACRACLANLRVARPFSLQILGLLGLSPCKS